MDIKKVIGSLCEADGVSGFENSAALLAAKYLEEYTDNVEIDSFGNVIGMMPSENENAETLLLDAHIDQIGFIVTEVLEDGFLHFASVGGVDPRMLLGCEVTILGDEKYYGVISCMPPHLLKSGESRKAIEIHDMVIDTGFNDIKDKITIGTPIVFREKVCSLSKDTITGKCLDDRAGVGAILNTLEMLKDKKSDINIAVLFSAQEEVGALGARLGTYAIKPDYIIGVDVSHAKTPDASAEKTFGFGKGALVGMGPNLNTKLTKALIKTAKENKIKYQLEVMEGNTGTNLYDMQTVAYGAATGLLSIPLKYMHTPIETVKISDIKSVSEIIYHYILSLSKEDRK